MWQQSAKNPDSEKYSLANKNREFSQLLLQIRIAYVEETQNSLDISLKSSQVFSFVFKADIIFGKV
jgi:Na+-transporting NADH:ubiquinone oxidoreductase subunit NqrF